MRYAKDWEIIRYSLKKGRVVITRDLDFGDILRYPDHPGAIILRLPSEYTARELNDVLRGFLSSVDEGVLQRAVIILELGRYRRRPLMASTK
jgi:predicted nuclease of predicted toxin-antitoxin system